MIGLDCISQSSFLLMNEIQKFVFSSSFTNSPIRSKCVCNSEEEKMCFVCGSLAVVTKSGEIPILGPKGHYNLFLYTFKFYGVHIREGRLSRNAFWFPSPPFWIQISFPGFWEVEWGGGTLLAELTK